MIMFPSILAISLIGIFILTRGYFREAKLIPELELKLRLKARQSLRNKAWEQFIYPVYLRLKNNSLPFLLKSSEYVINRARTLVVKFESKLKRIADTIHGKAIDLEVTKKSEYWENLNGNKNGNGENNKN